MRIRFSYLIPLIIAAASISIIGALFSITGLAKLFAGASTAVMVMAGALEFAKVISAGFVHQYWGKLSFALKAYLCTAVFTLMVITSAGIFGFLSFAYQNAAVALSNLDIKIQGYSSDEARLNTELKRIEKNIQDIPESRISKRLAAQKEYEPQIQEINKKIMTMSTDKNLAMIEKAGIQAKIGPLAYLSETLNVKMDIIAKWFILVFVLVFDPLAIVLVISCSWLVKFNEQQRQEEKPYLAVVKDNPQTPSTIKGAP